MDRHIPPHDTEIERVVLGEAILEGETAGTLADIIHSEEVFYLPKHQKIYQAVLRLHHREDARIDLITVSEDLKKAGHLKECGGIAYLKGLTDLVYSAAHVEVHAHLLLEKYFRRCLITMSTQVQKSAYDERVDVFDALDKAEEEVLGISRNFVKKNVEGIGDVIKRSLRELEARKDKKTESQACRAVSGNWTHSQGGGSPATSSS